MPTPLMLRTTVVALALACAGCEGVFDSGPECFAPSPAVASSQPERRALTDARERMAERCENRETRCRFLLEAQPAGITHVLVETASIEADGRCRHGVSPDVMVYDINGNYVETIPGY